MLFFHHKMYVLYNLGYINGAFSMKQLLVSLDIYHLPSLIIKKHLYMTKKACLTHDFSAGLFRIRLTSNLNVCFNIAENNVTSWFCF